MSAPSSTVWPRPVFTKIAVSFIFANWSAPNRPPVSGVIPTRVAPAAPE